MNNANKSLHKAKSAKNDEFYTQLSDIEKELKHYKKHFKNKKVFCNCDDPETSNFWKYFELNFEHLGLKRLISTHYEISKPSYKLKLIRDTNDDGKINKLDIIKTPLKQNGDFRSSECSKLLSKVDVVITNPPFSLFREFITTLIEHDKKFIIIGNMNAITYKEVFKLIKDNKVWLGHTHPKEFIHPDGSVKKFGNICWFTNLPIQKRNEELILYKTYNKKDYPKYDNHNAIEVSKVKDIPYDYYDTMGVPITFLDHYNPDQFKMLGHLGSVGADGIYSFANAIYIKGNKVFKRILIKRKEK